MIFAESELERFAREKWLLIRQAADLPETGWRLGLMSKRDDPGIARIVMLAEHRGGERLTFKVQLRPQNPETFQDEFDHQKEVATIFPRSAAYSVARPVFVLPEHQCALFEYVEGDILRDRMHLAIRDKVAQADLLKRAGCWLDALHRTRTAERRVLNSGHILNRFAKIRDEISSGQIDVPAKKLFLQGVSHLEIIARQNVGRETLACIRHGDLHMGNVIVSDTHVGGIDFSPKGTALVGYDISRLLFDYTRRIRNVDDIPRGHIVPPDALEAFFDGYKLVDANDSSVRMLLFAQILQAWLLIPKDPKERTNAKQLTLDQIKPIARNGFVRTRPANEQKVLRFLLTPRTLKRVANGNHGFINAVSNVLNERGFDVEFERNTVDERDRATKDGAYTMLHMENPIDHKSLCFRRSYAGPFWQIEKTGARWNWDVAKAAFRPQDVPRKQADRFFESWQQRLYPDRPREAVHEGFIYMPLQGHLLRRRSFQSHSPLEMIEATLNQSDLPIIATLHPNEDYSSEEMGALDQIAKRFDRFTVQDLPMEDALRTCDMVVCENSSAAFHAMFYGKRAILFAGIDFHHITAHVPSVGVAAAFDAAQGPLPDFAGYLRWFWRENAINMSQDNHLQQIHDRLDALRFAMS